jgi:hypothetical protein
MNPVVLKRSRFVGNGNKALETEVRLPFRSDCERNDDSRPFPELPFQNVDFDCVFKRSLQNGLTAPFEQLGRSLQ